MSNPTKSFSHNSFPSRKGENSQIPMKLEKLKSKIFHLQEFGDILNRPKRQVLSFGVEEIDKMLPNGGLSQGAIHEIFAADAGIATAFCAILINRLTIKNKTQSILWCENPWALDAGLIYGPAFLQFGINPEKLLIVRTRHDSETLWAMQEGLRCRKIVAVIGELTDMSLTASRRLQLTAEKNETTAFTLRPENIKPPPSAASTRWRLSAVSRKKITKQAQYKTLGVTHDHQFSKQNIFKTQFKLGKQKTDGRLLNAEMFRCRGGSTISWMMERKNETNNFSVVTKVRNRSYMPSATRLVR